MSKNFFQKKIFFEKKVHIHLIISVLYEILVLVHFKQPLGAPCRYCMFLGKGLKNNRTFVD
ncbi:MAG: hypothetical protein RIQ78_1314 [Bacteroidota bacterium]|jgi:hypothetical protein